MSRVLFVVAFFINCSFSYIINSMNSNFKANPLPNYIYKVLGDNKLKFHTLYDNFKTYSSRDNFNVEHVVPKKYLISEEQNTNLYNLFLSDKVVNCKRSDFKFTELQFNNSAQLFYKNGNIIDYKNRLFCPRECDKGVIARSIAYMKLNYNISIDKIIEKDVLKQWLLNKNNGLRYQEYCKYKFILKTTGVDNPFISKYFKKTYNDMINNILL